MLYMILIAIGLAAIMLYFLLKPSDESASEEKDWEYGDAWRERGEGGIDAHTEARDRDYVEIFRGDTGRGYDDSFMLDLVGFLGSRGIPATYDSFSVGIEPAGIKTYVLKVDVNRQDEAIELIRQKIQ